MRGSILKAQNLPQAPTMPTQQNMLFWTYSVPTQEDLDQLDQFFTANPSLAGLQLTLPATIIEAYQSLCRLFKIQMHPLLSQLPQSIPKATSLIGAESSIESIKGPVEQLQYLILQNYQLDLFTLRVLTHLWPNFPSLQVLKVFHSCLSEQELQQLSQMISKLKITKFFLEYVQADLAPILPLMYQIYFAILQRQQQPTYPASLAIEWTGQQWCRIAVQGNEEQCELPAEGDRIVDKVIGRLSITQQKGVRAIGDFLSQPNQLEYIGLAKNSISSWDDLKGICEQLARKKMSAEDLQAYRELEEKRENQLKLRAKKKGQEHEPLIQLDPMIVGSDGLNYIAKNQQMKVLNVAANGISDGDKDQIEKFIGLVGDNFQLVLLGCAMDSKIKEKLRKKSKNIIV